MRRRWLLNAASILGLAITVSAGYWQYSRGRERDRLAEEMAAGLTGPAHVLSAMDRTTPGSHRRASAQGVWIQATVVFQDNQPRGAVPGYHVFTALRLPDGAHVLVKRGWAEGGPDRSRLPEVVTPAGTVTVEGVALPPASRYFELGEPDLRSRVWPHVTVERAEQRFGLGFLPLVLEQHSGAQDGLVRDWPRTAPSSAKNYGYAFQWGAMATLIVVLNVYFRFRRTESPRAP